MKSILLILAVMFNGVLLAQTSTTQEANIPEDQQSGKKETREVKREEREKERAKKVASYVRFIDSLMVNHNFTFVPRDFQRQPAGSMRQISNPNFRVGVFADYVDITLPYYKGMIPPYAIVVMNYTVSNPEKFITVQKDEGWEVSFSSNLYSPNNYEFKFTIHSTTGEATLSVKSDFFDEVIYTGSVQENY